MNNRLGRIAAFTLAVWALGWGGVAHAGLIGIDKGTGNLYGISTTDASLTLIGNTGLSGPTGGFASLEFAADGTLYGFTPGSTASLYTINPATAAVSLIGALGNGFIFEGGLAIAPDGSAFGTNQNSSSNPVLFGINLGSGAATNIATIGGPPHDIDGLVYRSDGKLVGLDRITNSLLEIDPGTAASSTIAALTPTIGGVGGLVVTSGGMGFFATGGPGGSISGSNELYSVDLFTGTHSLIGGFGSTITGSGIGGLAFMPDAVPEPATLALFGAGLAGLGFMRRRRHA